jgi:lysophospholipase L1-like esterase
VKIHRNSTLLMIGDSITDCDRAFPIGDGAREGGLGTGYVSLVASLLATGTPDCGIRIVNMGISGNTVRDLCARWQSDVMDMTPDWVSIMIGINDVWRESDPFGLSGAGVPIEEFDISLNDLILKARSISKGLILMTPYVIEPDRRDPMRSLMDRYGEVVRRLANRYDAVFVDTQAAFDALLPHYHPSALAPDRVHPNQIGHMAIARAFMEAIGG